MFYDMCEVGREGEEGNRSKYGGEIFFESCCKQEDDKGQH